MTVPITRHCFEQARLDRRRFLRNAGILTGFAFLDWPAAAAPVESEIVLEINPSRAYPRSSEGAFLMLNSGRILFLYTRFEGGAQDHSPASIVSIYSDDEGRTWSRDPRPAVRNEGAANVMSVSLLRLRSGAIGLFYLVKNSLIDCRPVLRISRDETATWSEPRPVTAAPGYFVLNNDRVIQLQGGRLIAPLAFHRARGTDPKNPRSWDSRALVLWSLSDDNGDTWREAEDWWALPARTRTGFQEPGVVELADGRVFSWMRTDQGTQYGCWSAEGGTHWPLPEKTDLVSPASPASIKRWPGSAELLAIFNDHSGHFPFSAGKRSPLVAAISEDGGRSWPRRTALETDADGWYCYTAIHFTAGSVLLAYCAGDSKVGGLNRLRIRRVSLDSLRRA